MLPVLVKEWLGIPPCVREKDIIGEFCIWPFLPTIALCLNTATSVENVRREQKTRITVFYWPNDIITIGKDILGKNRVPAMYRGRHAAILSLAEKTTSRNRQIAPLVFVSLIGPRCNRRMPHLIWFVATRRIIRVIFLARRIISNLTKCAVLNRRVVAKQVNHAPSVSKRSRIRNASAPKVGEIKPGNREISGVGRDENDGRVVGDFAKRLGYLDLGRTVAAIRAQRYVARRDDDQVAF